MLIRQIGETKNQSISLQQSLMAFSKMVLRKEFF